MKCKSSNCFLVSGLYKGASADKILLSFFKFNNSQYIENFDTKKVFNAITSSNDQYQEVRMPAKHYFKLQISLSFTSTEVM